MHLHFDYTEKIPHTVPITFFPIHFIYGIHISDAGLMIAGDTHHRPLRILPSLLLSRIRFESINNHYLIARSLTIQVHSLELCYVFRFSFNARLTSREKKRRNLN